jgi:hypothetical protein
MAFGHQDIANFHLKPLLSNLTSAKGLSDLRVLGEIAVNRCHYNGRAAWRKLRNVTSLMVRSLTPM